MLPRKSQYDLWTQLIGFGHMLKKRLRGQVGIERMFAGFKTREMLTHVRGNQIRDPAYSH